MGELIICREVTRLGRPVANAYGTMLTWYNVWYYHLYSSSFRRDGTNLIILDVQAYLQGMYRCFILACCEDDMVGGSPATLKITGVCSIGEG